jgi:hypothetical protein
MVLDSRRLNVFLSQEIVFYLRMVDLDNPRSNNIPEVNWTERSFDIWRSMLQTTNRAEFEAYFKKEECWGVTLDTIHFGIQLYSTRYRRELYFKSSTTDGALILCSGCSPGSLDTGFRLRFYKHVDGLWRVSCYRGHRSECSELDEGARSYFMKPLQLAMLIKCHHPTIPTTGKEIQEVLRKFELYPYAYRKQAIYNLTHSILQYLQSDCLPLLPLNAPSIIPSSLSRRTKKRVSLVHPEIVLRGLTAFSEAFLAHDPDNRLFIERSKDGIYQRCTIIFGPVVRLSQTQSTGQYDVDGTYFKKINIKTGKQRRSSPHAGFLKGICYSDGNNCYYPIAIQHDTCEESKAGYKHMLNSLWTAFPHTASDQNAYASDRDSGLLGYLKKRRQKGLQTPNFVFCAFHLKVNVLAKYPGKEKLKVRETALKMFEKIAYCKRKDQAEQRLEMLQTKMKDLYDYLMEIGPSNFCDALMTSTRPEKMTSNSIESLWSHIQDIRAEIRVPLFFRDLYNFTINKIFSVEKDMLYHRDIFTPYAHNHMIQRNTWGKLKEMKLDSSYREGSLVGTIRDGQGRLSSISVQANSVSCTCQARQHQRIPCACIMRFLTLTRNERLLITRVHPSFLLASWKASLEAAIERPSSSSSSSSSSFTKIFVMQWQLPVVQKTESFQFPKDFGPPAGRKPKPPQAKELGIRPKQGTKPTFFDQIRESDLLPADSGSESGDQSSSHLIDDPAERIASQDFLDEILAENGVSQASIPPVGLSQELFPSRQNLPSRSVSEMAQCTGCPAMTNNVHGCIECDRPTHVFCGGRTIGPEGFEQRVVCKDCTAKSTLPSIEQSTSQPAASTQSTQQQDSVASTSVCIDSVQLQDLPRNITEEYRGGRFLNYLNEDGKYKRLEFSCRKCQSGIVSVKFRKLQRWDIYGICSACNACYKKVSVRTHPRTHRTTLRFALEEDQTFIDTLPEIITGLSDPDDIHAHAGNRHLRRKNKPRDAEREERGNERRSTRGDPRDSRNAGRYDTGHHQSQRNAPASRSVRGRHR